MTEFEFKVLKLLSKPDYIHLPSHATAKWNLQKLGHIAYEGNKVYKLTSKGKKLLNDKCRNS